MTFIFSHRSPGYYLLLELQWSDMCSPCSVNGRITGIHFLYREAVGDKDPCMLLHEGVAYRVSLVEKRLSSSNNSSCNYFFLFFFNPNRMWAETEGATLLQPFTFFTFHQPIHQFNFKFQLVCRGMRLFNTKDYRKF